MRRGVVLVAGGVLLWLLAGPGPLTFAWVPLLSGLVYLAVAAVGGRSGGYWAPAAVLCGWGLGALAVLELDVDRSAAAVYLFATGLGAVAAGVLERRGFGVSALGTGVAVASAGLVFLLADDVDALTSSLTYGLAFVAWGAIELARSGPEDQHA